MIRRRGIICGFAKNRAPRAIQRSARGFRSWVGATLIFGNQPMEVFGFFANHRCFSQEHLQTYPVASCPLHTLLTGSPASPEAQCWPVDCGTGGENYLTSLPLLRSYYASVLTHVSSDPLGVWTAPGIVAAGKQCCAETTDCWKAGCGVQWRQRKTTASAKGSRL